VRFLYSLCSRRIFPRLTKSSWLRRLLSRS
jgi:hypothetical protein